MKLPPLLGEAIGESELPWVEFIDEQWLHGMLSAGLPTELVGLLTEMGQGMKASLLTRDFMASDAPVTGSIKLAQFAAEFKERHALA